MVDGRDERKPERRGNQRPNGNGNLPDRKAPLVDKTKTGKGQLALAPQKTASKPGMGSAAAQPGDGKFSRSTSRTGADERKSSPPGRRSTPDRNRPKAAGQSPIPKKRPPETGSSGDAPAKPGLEKQPSRPAPSQKPARTGPIELPSSLTVRDLAEVLDISPIDVIKELMANGIMANINQQLDYDTAAIVAEELGFETVEHKEIEEEQVQVEAPTTIWQRICENERPENLKPRPPVVTVMGHVDHGKTSLLDAIRHTHVAADEVGGITQRIGAYQVEVQGKKITFLDTPGHEAFTAMRARGAHATDVAVLVVAADDGVMPQTKEAIDHARAARVPIIVALNKVDKPNANPDLVKQQLADLGLQCEEWGGDVICVPMSARRNVGIEDLLENILLVAEVNNLRANPNCPAVGTVIEGQLDKSRGPVGTVLVQNGTLRVGDIVAVGRMYGRIRAMLNDLGKPVKEATPSTPVKILGLPEVPSAGDILEVMDSEQTARQAAASRRESDREQAAQQVVHRPVSLDDVFAQMQAGKVKELNIVLKADAQGSLEPITQSLGKIEYENLKVKFISVGTGNVSESDISLAVASDAIVIAFSVDVDSAARRMADMENVDVRYYDIIYKLIEDVDKALRGMLEPVYEDVVVGRAEVRVLFRIPRKGTIAGVQVLDGKAQRSATVRVRRGSEVVHQGKVASLKRFTEDVTEVNSGFECGVGLEGFNDLVEGDVLEFFKKERVR